jgi:hypothetical protein
LIKLLLNKHLKISFLFKISDILKVKTAVSIAHTYSVDKTQETKPFAYHVYFVQNNMEAWKKRDIADMMVDLNNSKLLKPGYAGTGVCFPDILKGYSYFQYLDPTSHGSRGTLLVRNINLNPVKGRKDKFSADETRVDAALFASARDTLFNFGVHALRDGLLNFADKTYPIKELSNSEIHYKDNSKLSGFAALEKLARKSDSTS